MDRMISLTVGTVGVEQYLETFERMSSMTLDFAEGHGYVSLSAQEVDNEAEPELPPENLHYDENTLVKVRNVLFEAVGPYGHGDSYVDDLMHALQNAGILFRERSK